MASLLQTFVLLLLIPTLAFVASQTIPPATTEFDYNRYLAAMMDENTDHSIGDIGEIGCSNPDLHNHGDNDDDEPSHVGCPMCGGDHSDSDHSAHHAHGDHQSHNGHSHHGSHKKHYRLRIGMDMPKTGYLYVNDAGRLEGFLIDLIANVCRTAGRVCHPVHDLKDRCWDSSTDSPGTGLVSGWYDGCVGFFPTPEKYDSFDFSLPFSVNPSLALHFPLTNQPSDPTYLAGKKIGFISGLPMNAACIRRLAPFRGSFTEVQFDSMPQLLSALMKRQIDGFPWMANFTEPRLPAVQLGPTFTCTIQGLSVMTRKGDDLVTWWDEAYKTVVQSGAYTALCKKAREQPDWKGHVYCLDV